MGRKSRASKAAQERIQQQRQREEVDDLPGLILSGEESSDGDDSVGSDASYDPTPVQQLKPQPKPRAKYTGLSERNRRRKRALLNQAAQVHKGATISTFFSKVTQFQHTLEHFIQLSSFLC